MQVKLPSSVSPTAAACCAAVSVGYFVWTTSKKKNRRGGSSSSLFSTSRNRPSWMDDDMETLLFNTEDEDQHKNGDKKCIYLDYNGTTPIHPLVLAAMIPFLTVHFGNPSSSHYFGAKPRLAIQGARRNLLKLIGGKDMSTAEDSIWFTGCGTESDNLAIHLGLETTKHLLEEKGSKTKQHIVTSNVEHPAIEACLKKLEEEGLIDVTYVPVGKDGRVLASEMISAIGQHTVLVTLMLANNESGALQPVKEVAEYCRQNSILFHTDAAQACGKVSVNIDDLGGPDMVTLVGHKLGAPKGVAALYVRPGCLTENGRQLPSSYGKGGIMLTGGGQEGGRRAGTENVPYIAGFGRSAELALANLESNMDHMEQMRSRLLLNLQSHLGEDNVRPNGPSDPKYRLPNTLSVGLKNVQSGLLLSNISNEVAASASAACHSGGSGSISAVLRAMNVPTEFAMGTLRLSVGPSTTSDDIDRAASIIAKEAKQQLRASSK